MRTAGGHRRVTLPEAVRFVRAQGMVVRRPDLLGLPDLAGVPAGASATALTGEVFTSVLRQGEAVRARGLLMSAYLAGASVATLIDGPIAEALEALGEMWQDEARGVFIEHRATTICMEALAGLRLLIPDPGAGAPVAVGGSPAADVYLLPNLMAAAVLAERGVQTVNLGAHTPSQAFLDAVDAHAPALVWVALTSDLSEKERGEVVHLLEQLLARDLVVVVGGRTARVHSSDWPAGVHLLETMEALAAYAGRLQGKNREGSETGR